jgi:hypothetical protein
MIARSVLFLSLVVLAGCVRDARARSLGWIEARSENIVLQTDLSAGEARELLSELEDDRRALLSAFPRCRGTAALEPAHAVALRHTEDFELATTRDWSAGFFRSGSEDTLIPEPGRVVFPQSRRSRRRQLLLHELSHQLMTACAPSAPPWLQEGWAAVHETLRIEGNQVVVGLPAYRFVGGRAVVPFQTEGGTWVRQVPRELVPSVAELLSMSPSQFYDDSGPSGTVSSRYGGSWALVHYLHMGAPERLRRDFDVTLAAVSERPGALEEFMGRIRTDRLQERVVAYAEGTTYGFFRGPRPPPYEGERTVRELSEAEGHLVWVSLLGNEDFPAARRHMELAYALDPEAASPVQAGLLAEAGRHGAAERLLRTLDDTDPVVRYALARLALASEDRGRVEEARTGYGRGRGATTDEVVLIARLALALEQHEAARRYARAALRRRPTSPWARAIVAFAEAALGNREEAIAAADRALSLAGHSTAPVLQQVAALRAQLAGPHGNALTR